MKMFEKSDKANEKLDETAYYGDKAEREVQRLKVTRPIQNGIITNFDIMEDVWQYTFEELGVNSEHHPILVTEPPNNPKKVREKMAEIFFDVFECPFFTVQPTAVMAMYATGNTSAVVLDSGDGLTYALPVVEGVSHMQWMRHADYGGRDLNTLLAKMLAKYKDARFVRSKDLQQVINMKESLCYVSTNPERDFDMSIEELDAMAKTYKLPDGREVDLDEERWKVPEALFRPSILGHEDHIQGVGGLLWEAISEAPIDNRKDLMGKVLLSGGSTMFEGFSQRMEREMAQWAPPGAQGGFRFLNGHQSGDNRQAVCSGSQIFSSLRDTCGMGAHNSWVTKSKFLEVGPDIIHSVNPMKWE